MPTTTQTTPDTIIRDYVRAVRVVRTLGNLLNSRYLTADRRKAAEESWVRNAVIVDDLLLNPAIAAMSPDDLYQLAK